MKKLLVVFALALFAIALAGCATTQTAEVKSAPGYTFVIQPSEPSEFTAFGGQKVMFNPSEVLKKALMNEYKGEAAFIDGKTGPAGAIIVEPRMATVWTRGPIVKEGMATGYVNGKWIAGYYGEFDGNVDAKDAQIKVEGAAAEWAKKVRFEIAP